MAVQSALTIEAGTNQTWFGAEAFAGNRVVVLLGDRSGGVSATCSIGATALSLIHSLTTPSGGSDRRSLFLFEGVVPAGDPNPVLISQVLDGTATPVAHPRIAVIVDEGASYTLVDVVSAHSGAVAVTSQGTGSTAAAGGDLLLIAGETARGGTTVAWSTTSHTPANPGGGTWDLATTQSGNQNNARHASMGYATLTGQATQAWSDVVTLGTARMASALIAVWSADAGPPAITGTLAVMEADDSLAAAGTHTPPAVTGTLAATEAADTLAAVGTVTAAGISGTVAVTEQPDILAASGTVTTAGISGSISAVEQPDTLASTGTVTPPSFTGSLAAVEAADTLAASGTFDFEGIAGSIDIAEGVDTLAAAGTFTPGIVSGVLNVIEEADILTAAGTHTAPVLGTLAVVEAADQLVAAGVVDNSSVVAPTPPERTSVVSAESRISVVPAESRTLTIPTEVRRVDVPA